MTEDAPKSTTLAGALIGLAGFALWSVHDALVKSLGGDYATFQIVFFSVLMGFPLATLMLVQDRDPGTLRPVYPGWMAVRMVAVVVTGLCAFYAFSNLPLTQVYAIVFAMPLLITVLSIPILGETVRLRRWIAVLVGLVGVLVVLRPGGEPLELGHAAALTAAFGGALASVIVRKIGREERAAVMLLYPMLANFIVMGAALPFVYRPMPLVDFGKLAGVAALAFVGMLCMIGAYRRAEAVIVAPMQYSQLLWAVILGLAFFDERPDGWTVVGALIIIASGVFILLRESQVGGSNRAVLGTRARPETGTYARLRPLAGLPGRSGRGARLD